MLWLCASCGGGEPEAGESSAELGEPVMGAPAAPTVVRGHLVLGSEVRSIKPCDEERELWVVPVAALNEAYEALSPEPYAPVFVEVEGRLRPAPRTGVGRDYSGQLDVTSFRRAAPATEGFGCAEDLGRFAFRASGVEPFWHLRVLPSGLIFSTPELPETTFEAASPSFAGGGWVYESVAAGPEPIRLSLELRPALCTDPMVGAVYSWSASVDIGGEVLEGCAWEGALAPGR